MSGTKCSWQLTACSWQPCSLLPVAGCPLLIAQHDERVHSHGAPATTLRSVSKGRKGAKLELRGGKRKWLVAGLAL